MKKKIIIFGGTGFLGFNLAKFYKKKKWSVVIVSREKKKYNLLNGVKYITVDITKKNNLFKKLKNHSNANFVINASGEVDHTINKKVYESHYKGVIHIAKFFLKHKIKKFIQIGSSMEYGKLVSPQIETMKCKPISNYGKAKFLASKYLMKLYRDHNFPIIIVRPFQIYGPYQSINRLVPIVINSCLQNKNFLCSEGNQFRDFLYVEDFVIAISKLISYENIKGEVFNIGYGKPIKIKKIILDILKNIKKGNPVFGALKLRKEESLIIYPDISKLKKRLHWKPRTTFNKGLFKTINFYKK